MKNANNKKNNHQIFFCVISIVCIMVGSGCKKLVEVESPYTSINGLNVYTNDATAAAVLTEIYTKLSQGNSSGFGTGGFTSLSLFPSLSADELVLFNPGSVTYSGYYANQLLSIPVASTADYWSTIYPIIYTANSAIEECGKSAVLTPALTQQLIGEAKFIRAFCYFYLVNLYGDVPLVTTSDWQINASMPRTSKVQVYNQIITDLKDAQSLLGDKYLTADAMTPYLNPPIERIRPNKWVATALLARAYLYAGNNWADAEREATKLINNSSLFNLNALADVFKKNSTETIWALQSVGSGANSNTGEGKLFVLPATGPNGSSYPVYLSNNVVNSFELLDQRKTNWTGNVTVGATTYYYPNKYKIGNVSTSTQEYCMILRLSEQFLIRAEARAKQNNLTGAIADIDIIRQRAGLPLIAITNPSISQSALLTAILHERQVELFTEWGHRWFDLKRTGNVDAVMSIVTPQKGGTWQTTDQLYPILQSELNKAPQLIQNAGY